MTLRELQNNRNAFKSSHGRRCRIKRDRVRRKRRGWKVHTWQKGSVRIVRGISRNIAAFNWANAPVESTDRPSFVVRPYAGVFPHERWSRCLFPGQEGCVVPLGSGESMNWTCVIYIPYFAYERIRAPRIFARKRRWNYEKISPVKFFQNISILKILQIINDDIIAYILLSFFYIKWFYV